MVTIIKQPRWAFKVYEEVYEFEANLPVPLLLDRVLGFYSLRQIRGLVRGSEELHFSRGSVLGSLFSPSERFHKQNIFIRVLDRDGKLMVVCQYTCWDPFPNYHLQPSMLHREVQKLEKLVNKGGVS